MAAKPPSKYIFNTLALYGLLILSAFILEHISPGGPCTPGMGVMLFFLIPVISLVSFVIELYFVVKGRRAHFVPAIIHGSVFVLFLIIFFWR